MAQKIRKETNVSKTKHRRRRRGRQRAGRVLFIAGAALVVAALSLLLRGTILADRAGDASGEVMEQILCGEGEVDDDGLLLDGRYYIGYLTITDLDLQLPVMRECTMENLAIAPCRFYGDVDRDDLVIAGHNYRRHFSALKTAPKGTEVIFTDTAGKDYYFEISETETVLPTQIEKMLGLGDDHDWDMTLFTCTAGGRARCAVRCVRTDRLLLTW